MPGVIVSIRDSDSISYFKEISTSLIQIVDPEEVIISSGYFEEKDTYKETFTRGYYFSTDKNMKDQSVLNLLRNRKVILIGLHDIEKDTDFQNLYDNFKIALGYSNVTAYVKEKWHAKAMLMRKHIDGEMHTVVGIFGSSNCTRPAFGHSG